MESIEKLRERTRMMSDFDAPAVNRIADEIEAEIERDYMKVPVDAEGVPIHVGDVMCSAGIREKGHKVFVSAIFEDGFVEYGNYNGLIGPLHQEDWVHVKPRTLTDVLCDLFERKMTVTDAEQELRELMGGDE